MSKQASSGAAEASFVIGVSAQAQAQRSFGVSHPPGGLTVEAQAMHLMLDKALPYLKARLNLVFDSADNSLFELADIAAHHSQQNTYFEIMRLLRLKRADFIKAYTQSIAESIENLLNDDSLPGVMVDELPLLGGRATQLDQFEESVALEAMVTKVLNRDHGLDSLSLRMASLLPKQSLSLRDNPLGPIALCELFNRQCSALDLDLHSRLLLFKLFDKQVLNQLNELYLASNQCLIEQGVEALEAPMSEGQGDSASAEKARYMVSDLEPEQLTEELFVALQALMPDETRASPESIRALVFHTDKGQGNETPPARLRSEDEDAITLVSMLFNYIMAEPNLPKGIRQQFSLLQVPMLKVAIVDKSLFGSSQHPARRLLNEMASAALNFNAYAPKYQQHLEEKISSLVNRLLDEFNDDVSIFDALLEEFLSFESREYRHSEEAQLKRHKQQQQNEKEHQANMAADFELDKRLELNTLPEPVYRILDRYWRLYMQQLYLHFDEQSPEVLDSLQGLDELIWSVQDLPEQERRSLLKLVPTLLMHLRKVLSQAAMPAKEMEAFFEQLQDIHLQNFSEKKTSSETPQQPVSKSKFSPAPAVGGLMAQGGEGFARKGSDGKDARQVDPRADIRPAPDKEKEAYVSEVMAEGTIDKPEADAQPLKHVEIPAPGTWFDLEDAEGTIRCKLAAFVKQTGMYILVSRNGVKVAQLNRDDLSRCLLSGRLKAVMDNKLFDTALESVIDDLRKSHQRLN